VRLAVDHDRIPGAAGSALDRRTAFK
jgi:hypothetical protein